ncbi:MAG: hypothetical protein ACQ5SW_00190 [Sphaerochaetaceae bacterium]
MCFNTIEWQNKTISMLNDVQWAEEVGTEATVARATIAYRRRLEECGCPACMEIWQRTAKDEYYNMYDENHQQYIVNEARGIKEPIHEGHVVAYDDDIIAATEYAYHHYDVDVYTHYREDYDIDLGDRGCDD